MTGQEAYKGTTVAGFPNLFSLVGPNTGTGNMSLIFMIESQLNYLLAALRAMDRYRLATLEVRRRAQDSFNRTLQRRMRTTVWTTGCASWYLDRRGRNTSLWPGFALAFRTLTRRFDLHAYRGTPRPDADVRSTRPQEPRWSAVARRPDESVRREGRRRHRRGFRDRPGARLPARERRCQGGNLGCG